MDNSVSNTVSVPPTDQGVVAEQPFLTPSVPLSEAKAALFKALAHPARVRSLEILVDGERSVGELQPLVGIELSHLSQQLGILRRAGLVSTRREGSTVFYAIKDPNLAELLAVARRLLMRSLSETRDLLADLQDAGADE
ncbi:MAG TPA: metalloregulator ArsR/SmtB family transcription factor [Acidimicrobiales bacterium]